MKPWRSEFFWIGVGGLALVSLIAADVQGGGPLAILRLLLGLAYVLLVPGYALQTALFPERAALRGVERAALSFALSVAVVPPLALVLDALPWGLRLWPIAVGEGLVIAASSLAALARRRTLPSSERFELDLDLNFGSWWRGLDRTGRWLYGALAAALLTAFVSAAVIMATPNPAERMTEFYLLGPQGLAESYPRATVAGEQITVTVGIVNREGEPGGYEIAVLADGQAVGHRGPIQLEAGETWQGPVGFQMPVAGDDRRVEFLLSIDGKEFPYRRLQLWINVTPQPPQ